MENAKFKLSADCIEISGSQEFVEQQLESYKPLILSSYDRILNNNSAQHFLERNVNKTKQTLLRNDIQAQTTDEVDYVEVHNSPEVNHEDVYVMEGDKFQMISDVPGDSIRSQMIAVILIFMYAKLKTGIDTISSNELRDVCANYGALDTKNFAVVLDNNKKYFLLLGSGKSKTAKLVRPGIKEAERLIQEISNKTK